jgi:tRNA A58 N-methylase Trm61
LLLDDYIAEVRVGGNTSVIVAYVELGVGEEDLLLNVGSGFGTFMAHASRTLKCRAWGMEIVSNRISNAAKYFQMFVKQDMNLQLALYYGDIFDFDGFGPTTVVHLFDQAFEPWQVIHCIHCALRTQSVRYISSTKAGHVAESP